MEPRDGANSGGPTRRDRMLRMSLAHARETMRAPVADVIRRIETAIEDARRDGHAGVVAELERILAASRELESRVERLLDPATVASGSIGDPESAAAEIRHELRTPLNAILGYS